MWANSQTFHWKFPFPAIVDHAPRLCSAADCKTLHSGPHSRSETQKQRLRRQKPRLWSGLTLILTDWNTGLWAPYREPNMGSVVWTSFSLGMIDHREVKEDHQARFRKSGSGGTCCGHQAADLCELIVDRVISKNVKLKFCWFTTIMHHKLLIWFFSLFAGRKK